MEARSRTGPRVDEAPGAAAAPTSLEMTTRVVFAMIGEAGLRVAEATSEEDRETALREARLLLRRVLEGLRVAPPATG